MATNYTREFYLMDPGNPPAAGTALTPTSEVIYDRNDDNYVDSSNWDRINGSRVTDVWVGDKITVTIDGASTTITGVTFYTSSGATYFTATDGTKLQHAVFQSSTYVTQSTGTPIGNLSPPCFVAGTLILTPEGARAVETLEPGDLVTTRDHGAQPLRWIGRRTVPGHDRFAPIRIAAGALGNRRPLLVSPQHRMLLAGWRAELMFGEGEVLASAKHLVNGDTICRAPCRQVTYVHILFDRHEIVEAEGVPTESFHPGDFMLTGDGELREEVLALFPELADIASAAGWDTARTVLKAHEAQLMAMAA